ncbi:MAG: FHA domain-containing protein [Planctomycetes bacterium]|nr:FHA domain-containing protein [Planctomycetota bacterium]
MQVKLHLVKGNPQGKQVEVPQGTLTIGRAEDSDLIIASTRVSRHHCEILNEANRIIIRDKGSGNGTLVNGDKVQERVLAPGDEVQVGPLTFCVEIDGNRERPAAAAPPARAAAPPAARPAAPAKPAPAKAAPAARPAAAAPRPQPKPAARPGPAPPPAKRGSPADILASLERMAGPPKKPVGKPPAGQPPKPPAGQQKKGGDVLQISDEDLLDSDK